MIGGAVLCGGRSTRMGKDKAFVLLEGVTLARRTADVMASAGCSPVVLTGRQPELNNLGLPVIADAATDFFHPLLGVAAVLHSATTHLVLFAPCDVINLHPAHLKPLLMHNGPCVATQNGQNHPLVCVINTDQAPRAVEFAHQGRSVRDFVHALPAVQVPQPSLNDANSPYDLPR